MKVLVLNPANKGVENVVRDLLYGAFCRGRRIGGTRMPPLNLLYVATVLKNDHHQVSFVDTGVDRIAYEKTKRKIKNFEAVIILSSTHSFRMDLTSLEDLKKLNPKIKTIVFGAHPTFMPQYCLQEKCIDIIVRKEPEFIIKDLINTLDKKEPWQKIKGIGFKKNGKIILNDFYPFINNLDDLPIPDRSFLPKGIDYFNPVVKRMPYTVMQISRGCPGRCNFCTVPPFYGNRFRIQSAKRILDELRIIASLGYREVFFRDETLTAFPKRLEEVCLGIIKEGLDLTWVCNSRVDAISIETMRLMKKAGCHMIKFGVESGVQEILNNINKETTLQQARKAFKSTNEIGISTHAHVMLGCPGETKETIKQTVNFIKEINPTTVTFGIHTPYPGTLLFDNVSKLHPEIKDGTSCDLTKLHTTGFFNESFTKLSAHDLETSIQWAYRQFYFRLSYLIGWAKKLTSLDELKRVIMAGTTIFNFSLRGEK